MRLAPHLALRPDLACAAPAAAEPSAALGSPAVRWCMVLVLVSTTFLSRFGINLGSYSLDFSLIALYLLLGALLFSRRVAVDPTMAVAYTAGVVAAGLSLLVNTSLAPVDRSSPTSLLLLMALYLPLVATLPMSDARRPEWNWVLKAFGNVALICALAGIAQFYAQFVIRPPWLFDFTPLIPPGLRGPSGYNTVIEVGALYKSNGFFLREPSSFSFLMALAMIVELMSLRRWPRVGVFVLALLLSYSGTGVLALIIGLVFPLSWKTALRLLVLAGVGLLVFGVLGDVLNLSFTANRIEEFGSERSSAYIRYIAPMRVVIASIGSEPWTALLGHGPGTIQRTTQGIQFFDPTWAKLVFEYGLLGFSAFVALILLALSRSGVPTPLKAVLFMSWLVMGGHLLSPENVSMLYVLAAVWRPKAEPGGAVAGPADESARVAAAGPAGLRMGRR